MIYFTDIWCWRSFSNTNCW